MQVAVVKRVPLRECPKVKCQSLLKLGYAKNLASICVLTYYTDYHGDRSVRH